MRDRRRPTTEGGALPKLPHPPMRGRVYGGGSLVPRRAQQGVARRAPVRAEISGPVTARSSGQETIIRLIHGGIQPFIRLMSSTAIEHAIAE